MIPADVASRLRLVTTDASTAAAQPVVPTKQLTDVLSDLVPGQRVLAEVQALLPNGTYRAVIAQREITLALPFSAKTGDALELEVVENDGKMALAFVANRGAAEQGKANDSVSTSLSQTGKLIGELLGKISDQGKGPQPTPLNGNQPLLDEFPKDAAQLAPALKEALTTSGMFYEAHQARWIEGKLPTEALLQEPQGKLSLPQPAHAPSQAPGKGPSEAMEIQKRDSAITSSMAATESTEPGVGQKIMPQNTIPHDLAPLVRQQLDALATQNYVWQGKVWPGQDMHWEIEQEQGGRQGSEDAPSHQWRTRLKLTLPGLGGIDAVMRLRTGGAIDIALVTDSNVSRQKLAAAGEGLRLQLEDAGLNLTGLAVQHGEIPS